ncbi:MAG: SusC/RagA family TonB-linked outer membrane protein, partial [Prolixibacteraceae bacterium]|nr:SusC/RagA family TonB-linked outer membrane protein [Prolixibacteraceae bacterium]
MKLTFLLMVICLLQVSASVYSQTTKFTFKADNKQIVDVLREIEENSNFRFFYLREQIDVERKVSITANDATVEQILDELFRGYDIKYELMNDFLIVLSIKENTFGNDEISKSSLIIQQHTVSGRVTDERNQPLPGVTILVKETTQGTITNNDGEYTLTNVPDNAILVYSFVGMKSQEVAVGTRTNIDVILQADVIGIEEVVAIGYGTQRKADLTGSVASVKMEDKETVANVTLYTALKGTTAGVNVGGEAGAGSTPELSIRGQTSLSATDAPLVVIDGIIYYGSITDININDVESVDILKDASAAAVYGSRSSNGVILITTKRGKTEKPVFNVSAYYGFQDYTNSPQRVMNGDEFALRLVDFYFQQELYRWYETMPTSDAGKPVRPDVTDRNVVAGFIRTEEEKNNYLAGKEVDWMKEAEQNAPIQNYDISVSGVTDLTNYYLSLSHTDQKGRLLNDQFNRNTLRAKLDNDITDWMTIGVNASLSFLDYSGIAASYSAAMDASPLVDVTTPDGKYPTELAKENTHPLQYTVIDNEDKRENIFLSGFAKIRIPKVEGLEYEFNYANTRYYRKDATYYPTSTTSGAASGGDARKYHTKNTSWIFNNILTYSRIFGGDHSINATLLYSRESREGENTNARATSFDSELLGYNAIQFGTIQTVNSGAWEENSLSYMARANYSFKSRYLLTGTIRKDGFSGFGPNRKTATFPSLSFGWVISSEPFFSNVEVVDLLKLRTSVGKNGNQGIGRYSSFSKMATNAYV